MVVALASLSSFFEDDYELVHIALLRVFAESSSARSVVIYRYVQRAALEPSLAVLSFYPDSGHRFVDVLVGWPVRCSTSE